MSVTRDVCLLPGCVSVTRNVCLFTAMCLLPGMYVCYQGCVSLNSGINAGTTLGVAVSTPVS